METYVKKKVPKFIRDEHELGPYVLFPMDLIHFAREVDKEMPEYNLFYQNCQEWAMKFLHRISPHLVKNLPWTFSTWFVVISGSIAILLVCIITIILLLNVKKQETRF